MLLLKRNVKFSGYIYLLIFLFVANVNCTFKMTKVACESFNQSLVAINYCRLHAISRGVTVFNMNITILKPAYTVMVQEYLLKRENGYKPFLVNVTYDACAYMKRHNNPVINLIYGIWKDYSNINHTCPYVGDQLLNGFHLKLDTLQNLPLPNGEYALNFKWIFNKVYAMLTTVHFEYQM